MSKTLIEQCILLIFLVCPGVTSAQGLSLSVTPSLFEMSASPQQSWNSSIKVINTNKQELTVYANVVNFKPQGETGQGTLMPVFEERTEGKTLAEWITVSEEAFVIPRESSVKIPIQVHVPEDASPGGHYAAIMIGTRPPSTDDSFRMGTAQIVTSLFFVRIAGDVIEKGDVRAFRTTRSFVQEPAVDFEVRFENKGNVHLQPQGEILITNIWGKERGIVPINQQTNFGNVLPESIRKFEFTWHGEQSITDIGRYKAQLTLGFGVDGRQFVTQSLYFWVVPLKPVFITLSIIVGLLWFISWSIRSYVRRMLVLSNPQGYVPLSQRKLNQNDVVIGEKPSLRQPVQVGILDLKEKMSQVHALWDIVKVLGIFAVKNYKFFIGITISLGIVIILFFYIKDVTTEQRDYEIVIDKDDSSVTVSSEEILYEKTNGTVPLNKSKEQQILEEDQLYTLTLVNSSDTPGAAAILKVQLENQGYHVTSLESDLAQSKLRTVIVYDIENQDAALLLSGLLNNALLSADLESDEFPNISIFIGNDYHMQ